MKTCEISVLVPVYNTKKTAQTCIESVLNQTFTDWELVLVDDGSTDGGGELCDKYGKQDERIRVIHQANAGLSGARKTGIENRHGKYICFLDADDYMPRQALELLYSAAVKNNADLVCGNTLKVYGSRPWFTHASSVPCLRENRTYSHQEIIDDLYISYFGISNFPASMWGKLYRADSIPAEAMKTSCVAYFGEDLSFNMKVLPTVTRLTIITDLVYYYRAGGGTSRYMPYFLQECVAGYHEQKELIARYPMPQDATYYAAVALKNMLWTHLLMNMVSGKFNRTQMLEIIRTSCCHEVITEAVNHPKGDTSGQPGFRQAACEKRYEDIYSMLLPAARKEKLRALVARIIVIVLAGAISFISAIQQILRIKNRTQV